MRHSPSTGANGGAEFVDPTDQGLCPVCHRSRDVANANFN
jgi:rubredoxin